MANLYGIIGTSTPEHLLADPMRGDPIAVPMEPGNGEVKRGTLLYRKASGLWAAAAAAQVTNANLFAVLNETVNTGAAPASGVTAVAENAAAYRTGMFIDGVVKLAANAALTAAHKVVLARQGIFFDQSVEHAEEFVNSVTGA